MTPKTDTSGPYLIPSTGAVTIPGTLGVTGALTVGSASGGTTAIANLTAGSAAYLTFATTTEANYVGTIGYYYASESFKITGGSGYKLITAEGYTVPHTIKFWNSNAVAMTLASGAVSIPGTLSAGATSVTTLSAGATGTARAQLQLGNGDGAGSYTVAQIAMGYFGTSNYSHFIHTRHNSSSSASNAIDFYLSDGTAAGVFPTNAQLAMSLLGGATTGVTIPGSLSCLSLTETSSITLKQNINPITNALDSILRLTGVTYDRRDGTHKHEAGLIAEEVEKVLPNIVSKDEHGAPSGINYTKLTAYLIEAVKTLKAEIDSLKGNK